MRVAPGMSVASAGSSRPGAFAPPLLRVEDLHVVFSTRRNMPARVRHLLEYLREWARHPPEWAVGQATP